MGTRPNVVKESITPTITKKNIDTVKKQRNNKHLKKWKHPAAMNMTKVNHWINKDLLKELKQKTQ